MSAEAGEHVAEDLAGHHTTRYRVRWIGDGLVLVHVDHDVTEKRAAALSKALRDPKVRAQIVEAGYIDLPATPPAGPEGES